MDALTEHQERLLRRLAAGWEIRFAPVQGLAIVSPGGKREKAPTPSLRSLIARRLVSRQGNDYALTERGREVADGLG